MWIIFLFLLLRFIWIAKKGLFCYAIFTNMSKFKLKILLYLYKGIIAVKRRLISFFVFVFRGVLEKIGRGLATVLIFPLYKLYLRYYLKGGYYLHLLFNKKVFYILVLFFGLFLMASESKTYGTNKYIGGRESLLFQFLGPGEDGDFLEEEQYVNLPVVGSTDYNLGLSAQVLVGEVTTAPTKEIVGFNQDLHGVSSPVILPGVDFGQRKEIIKYVVQTGDSINSVASKFQISVDTIYVENKLNSRSTIRPGNILTILPVSGVSHKVKKGDTWSKIATTYKVEAQKIIDFNALSEKELPVGETIIIPDGKAPATIKTTTTKPAQSATTVRPVSASGVGSGMFWPASCRKISQYFGWRHTGIDVACPLGTPIYAFDDGVVEASGWNSGGYGYQVVINHGNGIKTRYAHNSKLFVKVGERVSKGENISLMGSTGRSTGSHLHFEVIVNGVRVNPFLYVR